MSKIYITDEVNDSYTAKVTRAGELQVETAGDGFYCMESAISDISGQTAASACWLKSVTIGEMPISAAALYIFNTIDSAGEVCAFGSSGDHIVAKIEFSVGDGSAVACGTENLQVERAPVTLPFNVYLSSGLTLAHGSCFGSTAAGVFRNVTVTYQY